MGSPKDDDRTDPLRLPFTGRPDGLEVDERFLALQEDDPLVRVQLPYGAPGWLVTRYDDVMAANADPRFSRSCPAQDTPRTTPLARRSDAIQSLDPPEHTRLRRLVSAMFTRRGMDRLAPFLESSLTELLDDAEARGTTDLVSEVAFPYTMSTICHVLGVPFSDRRLFGHWSDVMMSTSAYTVAEARTADAEIRSYMGNLVSERRADPDGFDDLLDVLVKATDDRAQLTDTELVTFGVNLLVAGHETTAHELSNILALLLTRRELWKQLVDDPGLIPGAIEEFVRYIPLGHGIGTARTAQEDIELSGGTVRQGECVFAAAVNANRDPRVFDQPHEIVLDRHPNPHLGFGHGAHYCLGASLARTQIGTVLDALVRRWPDLALVDPEVEWKQGHLFRGPVRLVVDLTPGR